MIVHVILARVDHTFGWHGGVANQLTLVAVTVLAVLINRTLTGQSARTRRARQVAAVAQAAVLPRPPRGWATSPSPPATSPPRTRP